MTFLHPHRQAVRGLGTLVAGVQQYALVEDVQQYVLEGDARQYALARVYEKLGGERKQWVWTSLDQPCMLCLCMNSG